MATDLAAVRFTSPNSAWALSHDAVILCSDDVGDHWVLDGRAVLTLLRREYPSSTAPALETLKTLVSAGLGQH